MYLQLYNLPWEKIKILNFCTYEQPVDRLSQIFVKTRVLVLTIPVWAYVHEIIYGKFSIQNVYMLFLHSYLRKLYKKDICPVIY